jgi:hypothetical protein
MTRVGHMACVVGKRDMHTGFWNERHYFSDLVTDGHNNKNMDLKQIEWTGRTGSYD